MPRSRAKLPDSDALPFLVPAKRSPSGSVKTYRDSRTNKTYTAYSVQTAKAHGLNPSQAAAARKAGTYKDISRALKESKSTGRGKWAVEQFKAAEQKRTGRKLSTMEVVTNPKFGKALKGLRSTSTKWNGSLARSLTALGLFEGDELEWLEHYSDEAGA